MVGPLIVVLSHHSVKQERQQLYERIHRALVTQLAQFNADLSDFKRIAKPTPVEVLTMADRAFVLATALANCYQGMDLTEAGAEAMMVQVDNLMGFAESMDTSLRNQPAIKTPNAPSTETRQ